MEKNCDPPRFDFPNYAGFPVQECAYENLGLSARVVMLNAPAEKLASWTVSACTKFSANKIEACSLQVAKRIWEQSNGQFVVAGIVIEEASVIGGTSNEGMNFEFRDGVTVKSVLELNGSSRQLTDRELEGSLVATVLNTKVYARPAGTTREQYVAAGGSIEVGKSDPHSARNLQWLEAVRAEYKTAWTTDNNLLIDAWVKDYFK